MSQYLYLSLAGTVVLLTAEIAGCSGLDCLSQLAVLASRICCFCCR